MEYAPRLRNLDEGYLRDKLWKCMDRGITEELASKLGAEWISQISSTQLMVEIERVSIQKQCNTLNKIKLFEAKHGVGETIRGFVQRLCRLAYACNFTAECTEANTEVIILMVLVRGMNNMHTQAELLAEVEQMSLGDTVALIAIREEHMKKLPTLT